MRELEGEKVIVTIVAGLSTDKLNKIEHLGKLKRVDGDIIEVEVESLRNTMNQKWLSFEDPRTIFFNIKCITFESVEKYEINPDFD